MFQTQNADYKYVVTRISNIKDESEKKKIIFQTQNTDHKHMETHVSSQKDKSLGDLSFKLKTWITNICRPAFQA